jgi:hypothetical protein
MPRSIPTLAVLMFALSAPTLASAQSLAAAAASPTLGAPVVWSPAARAMQPADSTMTQAAPLAAARPVALLNRSSSEPARAPRVPQSSNRNNTALMLVGLATIVVGTVVDGDTGTLLILGGAGIGLLGLYRWLQ